MKKLNFSLAALCAFAYSANAQSLEDAIKGVEVGGFLRYEYEDNRFKNQLFQDGANGDGTAEHTWRTEAEFKTPVQNNVALALGIYYETSNNVNHGKGSPANAPDSPSNFLGDGLGSGKDGEFGVSTFYATVAPDFTSTNITLGKMRLDTPLNDNEEDRGTGILAVNSDIPNVSLVAGAFDSWALDDLSETFPEQSIAKPLYTLAALANYELGIGNLEAQAWIFHIDDILDSSIFAQLSFNHALFHLSAQYAYANLNNQGFESLLGAGEYQNKGDFISLEAGIDLESLKIPLQLSVGYITNTQDNFGVSLDNEVHCNLQGLCGLIIMMAQALIFQPLGVRFLEIRKRI